MTRALAALGWSWFSRPHEPSARCVSFSTRPAWTSSPGRPRALHRAASSGFDAPAQHVTREDLWRWQRSTGPDLSPARHLGVYRLEATDGASGRRRPQPRSSVRVGATLSALTSERLFCHPDGAAWTRVGCRTSRRTVLRRTARRFVGGRAVAALGAMLEQVQGRSEHLVRRSQATQARSRCFSLQGDQGRQVLPSCNP